MKRFLKIFLIALLAFTFVLSLAACKDDDDGNNDPQTVADDDYTLEIEGLDVGKLTVTKKQIKELYSEKPVTFDSSKPAYASDKTDDDGNKIPHTLKGVYLDDIISKYSTSEKISGSFPQMTLYSKDGYQTVITQEQFSVEYGGSLMIVAFEYDGITLTESEKSGALRAVFDEQVANTWAKKLTKIAFGNQPLSAPETKKVYFFERLGDSYNGSFEKSRETGTTSISYTYFGVSVAKLIDTDTGIFDVTAEDKMFITAWDYNTNGTDGHWNMYFNTKNHDIYATSYFVYAQQASGEAKEDDDRAPIFDGVLVLGGMSVKNVMAAAAGDVALVTLEGTNRRFGENGVFSVGKILETLDMSTADSTSYKVYKTDGTSVTVAGNVLKDATVTKSGSDYVIAVSGGSFSIERFEIAE